MLLISPEHGPITLTPINSENFRGPILPGSNIFFYENDFGTILIQHYKAEHFSLRLGIFNLIKKVSFLIEKETSLLKSRLFCSDTFAFLVEGLAGSACAYIFNE